MSSPARRAIVARASRPVPWSLRIDARSLLVTLAMFAVAAGFAFRSLLDGDYALSAAEVADVFFGTPTWEEWTVVVEWRLPRAGLAVLVGACLGVSGAIFQSLTRNPLGSPDVIGFNTGAYTGALIAMLLLGGGFYTVATGAITGGLVVAAAVYALAYTRGVHGFRLIIVGIGVNAMLAAVNTVLILQADLRTAVVAAVWGAGSLTGLGWQQLTPAAAVVACLIPGLVLAARPARVLEMGDESAAALGVRPEALRRALLVLGVAAMAVATAAAGPIAFVALAAPQIARRLTRGATVAMLPAAATGAALLAAADWAAQHAFSRPLPVGVLTVAIGGLYLIWLLLRESRGH